MKKIGLFLMLLVMGVLPASAQRRLVVADMETLLPIAGVNVISRESSQTTDSTGHVNIDDRCKSFLFSHVNYESRLINLSAKSDTVFLISKLLNLDEVVVSGRGKKRDYSELQNGLRLNKTDAQLLAAKPIPSFDIAKVMKVILPKKWRPGYRKELRKKRLKEALDEY